MTSPKLDRRQMLKLEAAAIAAAAAGMPAPALAANLIAERDVAELKWDKAACRFCGTGCSVMVATKNNRVVATMATPRPRSIAASTASRATSSPRSCTATTA
ncbi:anaerobic selenocysteine-containing dehydrogenase [Bradyrhizobium sp. GM5.1]